MENFVGWIVMAFAALPAVIALLLARSGPEPRKSSRDYSADGRRPASNKKLEIDAAEFRLCAERRLGEMLVEQKRSGSGAQCSWGFS